MSVYRDTRRAEGLPGGYCVTSTVASARLWNCIRKPDENHPIDPRTVRVSRGDAPLPESTARVVHNAWLAILAGAKPPPAGSYPAVTPTAIDRAAWTSLADRLVRNAANDADIDLGLISPIIHSRDGAPIEFVPWGNGGI